MAETKPFIYTEEFVKEELKSMLEYALQDQGVFFIGQLFESKPYSRQRFSEWATKFKDSQEISDTIKRIEELLETRLVTGGLTSALNPTLTIFTLKNKHDWEDKNKTELSGSLEEIRGKIGGFLDDTSDPNDAETSESEDN